MNSTATPPKTIASDLVGVSTHGRLNQLNESTLRRRLLDAEEQLTYWQGAKFRALHQRDKHAAGARVLIWEAQVSEIRRRLRELNRAEALTA